MKIRVDIADSLFEEAKACAASRGVPLREIVEERFAIRHPAEPPIL